LELNDKQLKKAIEIVEDKKGREAVLLNVKGISMVTDYFMIVTGNTPIQVKAIAHHLEDKLPEHGIPTLRVEGLREGKWVLVDCGDLVVHVMTPEMREFYKLERLWGDAEVLSF